jgi:excisionase family DNA binding protein
MDWLGGPFATAELAKGFKVSERTVRRILQGPPPPPSDAPLTVKDAAVWLRCRHHKIKDLIQSGQLAARNIGTAARPRWLISREALQEFIRGKDTAPRPSNAFRRYRSS